MHPAPRARADPELMVEHFVCAGTRWAVELIPEGSVAACDVS